MKSIKYTLLVASLLAAGACDQEPVSLTPPEPDPVDTSCEDATAGTLDLTKFIALGNSLTAGFQAGALFNEGQQNSIPKILAEQFACAGGSEEFNQPDVNSVNGCYNYPNCTLGRLILYDADGTTGAGSASPTPSNPTLPPPYNTAGPWENYAGDKATLNNFGVPGVKLIEATLSNYGTLNPYYARFASDPASKSLLVDAAEKQPTFFMMWLGSNDVLKYAIRGGIDNAEGTAANDMTPAATFEAVYTPALTAMLGASAKGVVANIPNVTSIPYFTTIPWNTITLDQANATALTTQLANNYNAILAAAEANDIITAEEKASRMLTYTTGKNGVLITDENLTDLTTFMVNAGASALVPYAKARQTKSNDLICLSAGSYLGKNVDITGDGNPDGVNGVSIPLFNNTNSGTASLKGDDLTLIYPELVTVSTRVAQFNQIIANAVSAANNTTNRVALVDVNAAFNVLIANAIASKGTAVDGVTINPVLTPPTGVFSEDGIHPNSRGAAYIAKLFIEAINAKFGSSIPSPNISEYKATGLPLNPL